MKKLATLSIALLFSAGSVFAQSNDATVEQDGSSLDATITQLRYSRANKQGFAAV